MSKFTPNKKHSWTALNFFFHLKKPAAESYRLLQKAYGDHVPLQDMRELWFQGRLITAKKYYELLKPGDTVDTKYYQ